MNPPLLSTSWLTPTRSRLWSATKTARLLRSLMATGVRTGRAGCDHRPLSTCSLTPTRSRLWSTTKTASPMATGVRTEWVGCDHRPTNKHQTPNKQPFEAEPHRATLRYSIAFYAARNQSTSCSETLATHSTNNQQAAARLSLRIQ
jgi:hypothetical protein